MSKSMERFLKPGRIYLAMGKGYRINRTDIVTDAIMQYFGLPNDDAIDWEEILRD
jgi:hypothetical protein